MDIGQGAVGAGSKVGGTRLSLSVAGLFGGRRKMGVDDQYLDEYDAAASTDAEEYIDDDKRRRSNPFSSSLRSQHYLTLIMALIAITLVISAVSGGIAKQDDDITNEGSYTVNSNSDATASITSKRDQRYVNVVTRITEESITPKDVFSSNADTSSPQQLALNWLVYDDPAYLGYDHPALLDRYVLAVFYFSSSNSQKADHQGGWAVSTNWMTGEGICNWHGVECVPREQEATAENDYTPYTKTYNDNARVTAVKLPDNKIVGVIPDEFGSSAISELLLMDFGDNELGQTLPSALGNQPKLRDIILKGNKLIGTLPSKYESLNSLHQLDLARNQLEGSIPNQWKHLTGLRYLSLSHNFFNGTFVDDFFSKMTRMTGLFLEDNSFKGTFPESIGKLTDLLDLRLGKNHFTGSLNILSSLLNLETLHANNNALTGTLPDMFDQLFRLHEIMIQENQLEGPVPITLTHLQSLRTLNLAHNKFDGTVPPGLGLLTDVVTIALNHNEFRGKIPSLLGKLNDATTLTLSSNNLSGNIPSELGGCFRLKKLFLDSNVLEGNIPAELGELTALKSLKLESNGLDGQVPSTVCALRDEGNLKTLTADCLGEEPVVCGCCTKCM